ncbi:Maf-like protein [Rhizobium sp. PAMB 3174]
MQPTLILASTSPFRRMLMENAGLQFSSVSADINERAIEESMPAAERTGEGVASRLAAEKALEVSRRYPNAYVIGSDQTMSLDGTLFHKPKSSEEARRQLAKLAGRTHRLNSAVAIAREGVVVEQFVSHADLTMRAFSDRFLDRYIETVGDKALLSVGGYQLEGEGIQLFEKIEGDYFTILGLPLLLLLQILRTLDVLDA